MISSLIVLLVKFLTGASVRWQGCGPEQRQRIYFANHTSNLDGAVLWASFPAEIRSMIRPVAAVDYWTRNFLRRFLAVKVFNTVLIERRHITRENNPLDQLLKALDGGSSLIIFPEGGRNPGPEVMEFKSGLYYLGRERPGVELVPVHIDNMNRILPKGEILPVPLLCCISFGSPLRVEEGEEKSHFLERARKAVNDLWKNG